MATTPQVEVHPGKLLIGSKWVDASTGATFPTVNPASGETITHLAEANPADVETAVRAARAAFEEGPWPQMSASDRGKLLYKIGDLIEKHIDEFAYLETIDNGKPIFESRYVDMPMIADVFRYYAGWTTKIHGETIPVSGPFFNYTLREPIGVVAAIVP